MQYRNTNIIFFAILVIKIASGMIAIATLIGAVVT